jgi:pimeloyl-ACP methyl ester carboxylesterase
MTARTVALRDGRAAVVHEAGTGAPLLWLHGLNGIEPEDDAMVAALARHHRVLAPVAPGFADPAELDDLHDVHDLAMHYDDLCTALELPPVTVVGHSFGGMAAAELVAHHPGVADRLVLVAPFGLWDDADPIPDLFARPPHEMADLLWSNAPGEAAEAGRRLAALNPNRPANVELVLPLIQGLAAAATFTWPIPDKGLARRLSRVTCPTLLLWGREDRLVPPSYAERFRALLPRAEVELVTGAHMLPVEQPELVAERVARFAA